MRVLILMAVLALAACKQDEAANHPAPVAISDDALGFFCQMSLRDHKGPRAQIALEGFPTPIFFSQVRDGIAYLKSPEKDARILAFYVSDMSKASSWATPGVDNWMLAKDAYYVVGSDAKGGMGAPELVPYSVQADAAAFAATHGGTVMHLPDIPAEAVLGAIDNGS